MRVCAKTCVCVCVCVCVCKVSHVLILQEDECYTPDGQHFLQVFTQSSVSV